MIGGKEFTWLAEDINVFMMHKNQTFIGLQSSHYLVSIMKKMLASCWAAWLKILYENISSFAEIFMHNSSKLP